MTERQVTMRAKMTLKTYLHIIFHFTVTYGIEFIHICFSNMLKILYNGVLLYISSQFCVIYIGS